MPRILQGGAWAAALPSGVWEHSPARSCPTTPVGKRSVPRAPGGVLTYGRRPTDAVTRIEEAGAPQSAGGRNSADSENPKGRHEVAPCGVRGKICPSFVPPGFRAALPTDSPSARPFPGAHWGHTLGPQRQGFGGTHRPVQPWDLREPLPPWSSWAHPVVAYRGGLTRPPFCDGTGLCACSFLPRLVRPRDSWGPRPPWPSWVHSVDRPAGGFAHPHSAIGPGPSGCGLSLHLARLRESWEPRPPWPSWVHSVVKGWGGLPRLLFCVGAGSSSNGHLPRPVRPRDSWGLKPPWPS